jgi:pyruvate dehydrogenase phosphatase
MPTHSSSGWATSAKLRHSLIPHVYFKLEEAYKQARARGAEGPLDSEIDDAIKAGFLGLDHEIVVSSLQTALETKSKQIGAQVLGAAIAGSCALLSFYDTGTQLLRVACTGDCRAVLGRRVGPKWSATQLSSDQTGANPDEIARVKAEHPDEEGVAKNGRVMGYEPSRAFGDAVLKWPRETSLTLRRRFFAKWASEKCLTPPYMTAEPVITTTKIHPENGDFVVLASDSLWEMLSNEEVVGLVGRWIDEGRLTGRVAKKQASFWGMVPWFSSGDSMTSNVEVVEIPESERPYGEGPVRPSQWGIANRPRTPVVKDVNVATHIARNGLGGDDHDMISSLFMLAGSNTRRYR